MRGTRSARLTVEELEIEIEAVVDGGKRVDGVDDCLIRETKLMPSKMRNFTLPSAASQAPRAESLKSSVVRLEGTSLLGHVGEEGTLGDRGDDGRSWYHASGYHRTFDWTWSTLQSEHADG